MGWQVSMFLCCLDFFKLMMFVSSSFFYVRSEVLEMLLLIGSFLLNNCIKSTQY